MLNKSCILSHQKQCLDTVDKVFCSTPHSMSQFLDVAVPDICLITAENDHFPRTANDMGFGGPVDHHILHELCICAIVITSQSFCNLGYLVPICLKTYQLNFSMGTLFGPMKTLTYTTFNFDPVWLSDPCVCSL